MAPNEDEGGKLEEMAPEDYWRILEGGASSSQPQSFNRRAWGFYTRSCGNEIQEVILEMSTNKTSQGAALKLRCGKCIVKKP